MRARLPNPRRAGFLVSKLLIGLSIALAGVQSAAAGDGGDILFYEGSEGPALFRSNTTGTFTDALTQPPAEYTDHSASWSPTGLSVAFERSFHWYRQEPEPGSEMYHYRHRDPTIIITDRQGQRERPLIKGVLPAWSGWSPNKIAFGMLRAPDDTKSECIHVINADGTGLQRIGCVGAIADHHCTEFYTCFPELRKLAWTRTGKYIVAHVATLGKRLFSPVPDEYWVYTLFAAEVATGRLVELPSPFLVSDMSNPISFSVGAGDTVYYDAMEWSGPAIYRMHLPTNTLTRVMDGSAPLVSPDGKKIAFTQRDGSNRYSRLFVANADGSGAVHLAGPTAGVQVVPLDWSADGSHILLQRRQGYNHSLHLVTTTGQWRTVRRNAGAETGAWQQR
ncbi:PD40 domain-containing protein [Vulcaniibacterium tengchongense]|uniref:WD40 repeat protein n=1 Tax=Vulcaniibacterium tengchongense TaxID=1273429 RepID=A0A3N4VFU0_9GAMM|nr:PD40 domain-containing protein [Vulcaniibacterium tengchongense]RPE81936.1 WD40 repeat protein [Vulcaniibacterium tengchongense]